MAVSLSDVAFHTVYARDIEQSSPDQQWLIEGLWAQGAVGVLGGPPKCAKTFLGLDMAVSVASATPALGHFEVQEQGRALVYLAEDALPQVRARIEALCLHRQLDIRALDLVAISEPTLRLDLPEHRARLNRTLESRRPRLMLLDPLIRMHRRDENSSADMSELLSYLRDLQRTFDVAIVLVHHASKKQRAQPGQALRGSSDLHALGDCNVYLARRGEEIVLTIEHRAAPSPKPITLALVTGEGGAGAHLEVCRGERRVRASDVPLDTKVLELLEIQDAAMPRTDIRQRLKVNNQRLGDVLTRLELCGRVCRTRSGWALPHAVEPMSRDSDGFARTSGETEAGSAEAQPAKG